MIIFPIILKDNEVVEDKFYDVLVIYYLRHNLQHKLQKNILNNDKVTSCSIDVIYVYAKMWENYKFEEYTCYLPTYIY